MLTILDFKSLSDLTIGNSEFIVFSAAAGVVIAAGVGGIGRDDVGAICLGIGIDDLDGIIGAAFDLSDGRASDFEKIIAIDRFLRAYAILDLKVSGNPVIFIDRGRLTFVKVG